MRERIDECINGLTVKLLEDQQDDGSWRYHFAESGMMTDTNFIILLRTLGLPDKSEIVSGLTDRILSKQLADGTWRVYPDEARGNLSAMAECLLALVYAGLHPDDPRMQRAKAAIVRLGGVQGVDSLMTKFTLAITGYKSWPAFFPVPLALLLLPTSSPIHFFHFSGYARVHMAPMLILGERKRNFKLPGLPFVKELHEPSWFDADEALNQADTWSAHLHRGVFDQLKTWTAAWKDAPHTLKKQALRAAEQFMLNRIEADGTLYSYATSTILMIYALLALGYERRHPIIAKAVEGLTSFLVRDSGGLHLQTTTSAVWDTALISYALREAGIDAAHSSIRRSGRFLFSKQHSKLGDWQLEVHHPVPGGWGFSDINTINPDVDDTTAALRAIEPLRRSDQAAEAAAGRGLQWILSMQNNDGGWGAFERNNNHPLIHWLPLDGADAAATDPSCADLTGRTLEYLGHAADLTSRHPFVRKAVRWLYDNQEPDGSWYGRWGICYIYGTWAALTGLTAVRETIRHPAIRKATDWLLSIQRADGGFGESCESDRAGHYVPLRTSSVVQTAWALDSLVAVHEKPVEPAVRAADFLLRALPGAGGAPDYPTGAGLPGNVYFRYESYPLVWPLVALSHFRKKFL